MHPKCKNVNLIDTMQKICKSALLQATFPNDLSAECLFLLGEQRCANTAKLFHKLLSECHALENILARACAVTVLQTSLSAVSISPSLMHLQGRLANVAGRNTYVG